MKTLELVCINSLKDIATKNFEAMMAFELGIDDIELLNEYALLQAKAYMLTSNKGIAQLQETTTYNLPGCKMIVYRFIVSKKEKLFVATVYDSGCNNSCYPNGKIAKK